MTKQLIVLGLCLSVVGVSHSGGQGKTQDKKKTRVSADRKRVVQAGMTEQESVCWELAAALAGQYFRLDVLHRSDRAQVVDAIHVVQNKLMSRPTYKKYLKLAGAPDPKPARPAAEKNLEKERELVSQIGLNPKEAECWLRAVRMEQEYAKLPALHPMELAEVRKALRVVQTKLMSRPAYRRYRELSRKQE